MYASMRAGFSFIQLSMVLIIIGLVIGGFIGARDLTRNAAVRSQISQFSEYDTATTLFINKYEGIPGDITNATSYFTNTAAITILNGDGNGRLKDFYGDFVPGPSSSYLDPNVEATQFFAHLFRAGFTNEEFNNQTVYRLLLDSPIKGQILAYNNYYNGNTVNGYSVNTADGQFYYLTGVMLNAWDYYSVNGYDQAWDTITSHAIDAKLDDGLPVAGKVRITCWDYAWFRPTYDPKPGQGCREQPYQGTPCVTGASQYNLSANPRDCGLRVQTAWP